MARYFQSFPTIPYNLTGPGTQPVFIRNVFFRLKIMDAILKQTAVYYPYFIQDGETPEMIAYKYYKDSNLYWVIMLANQIVDPWYDWPLDDMSWLNYMNAKYGSIDNAQELIDHYALTTSTVNSATAVENTQTVEIDLDTYNSTPAFTFEEINLVDGSTVAITITTSIVSVYTQEFNNNEAKKQIQLLDAKYISQIQLEFNTLTAQARSNG